MKSRLALSFGEDAVLELAWTSWLGCLPLFAWGGSLIASFGDGASAGLASPAIGIGILAALIAPALVPVIVLRARDPESHVEWDEREIREHRGALVRCAFPIARASAALREFTIAGRRAAWTTRALQIFDNASGEVITVWEHAPPGVAAARRRLCVESVEPLRAALVQLGVPFDRDLDLARAQEPDRVTSWARITAGRFGYVLAFLAVTIAPSYRVVGVVLGAAGAALLALRAVTSVQELRSVMVAREPERQAEGGPYRGVGRTATAAQLGRIKRGAVIAEVAVRLLVVVLAVGCPLVVLR